MKWGKFLAEIVKQAPAFFAAVSADPEEVRHSLRQARMRARDKELSRINRIKRERGDK